MSQHSSNGRDPWWQKSADNRHFIVDGADAVIGRGAFGTTYRMRHTVDGRLYAVKAIDTNRVHHLIEALQGVAPGSLSKTSTREKVKGEALLLANLNHANCVRYATAWFEGPMFYLAMEFVAGGTLAEHLSRCGSLSAPYARSLFAQLLLAVQHIHDKRMIHRDIKSANLFLSMNKKRLKLGDLGLGAVVGASGYYCRPGGTLGSCCYRAPEAFKGLQYGTKADLWSSGCVLFEMLSGFTLDQVIGPSAVLAADYDLVGEFIEQAKEDYDPSLAGVLKSLLELQPRARPSASEALEQLRSSPGDDHHKQGYGGSAASVEQPAFPPVVDALAAAGRSRRGARRPAISHANSSTTRQQNSQQQQQQQQQQWRARRGSLRGSVSHHLRPSQRQPRERRNPGRLASRPLREPATTRRVPSRFPPARGAAPVPTQVRHGGGRQNGNIGSMHQPPLAIIPATRRNMIRQQQRDAATLTPDRDKIRDVCERLRISMAMMAPRPPAAGCSGEEDGNEITRTPSPISPLLENLVLALEYDVSPKSTIMDLLEHASRRAQILE